MKNRKTSPGQGLYTTHRRAGRWHITYCRWGDLGAEISQWLSALRQIRHAGVLGTMFPQEREMAVLDLPEADVAVPMVREHLTFRVWNGRVGIGLCLASCGSTVAQTPSVIW
ncbi:hypothetical protein CCANI_06040 [Corynebacterium canis]|nr:hypothetical protein CCANI_06040 [Corynebacterium canis]